jgi:penicillin-binding protein 1A
LKGFFYTFIVLTFNSGLIALVALAYIIFINSKELPDYKQLAAYNPPVVTRLYANDGRLLEEYAKERRLFVPISAIPKPIISAFLSAEDKNFYSHPGVDISSISRALLQNFIAFSQNKQSLVGGSTITQQVVKNFLLTKERTITRKIKEAILSFRISKAFTKDRILELYLNQIYLGGGNYGVASAALDYFGKSINELSAAEAALLASLPKAPNVYNPRNNYKRALSRRNWVLSRMAEEEFISDKVANEGKASPIKLAGEMVGNTTKADFFAEAVRQKIATMYGEQTLYGGGLFVRTTLDPKLQKIADDSLRKGIIAYDQKQGYRGPIIRFRNMKNWRFNLRSVDEDIDLLNWKLGVILGVRQNHLVVGTKKSRGVIPYDELKWALKVEREPLKKRFSVGDVVPVEYLGLKKKGKKSVLKLFGLRQIPEVNGGLIAMNPHTGRVLALAGGYNYESSKFNRVTQAKRQPGSVFKPIVYLSALENGMTPSTIIVDEPIEVYQGANLPMWRPKNYHSNFLGDTTLRRGLELSRNTMTVNVAQKIGLKKIVDISNRLGIGSIKKNSGYAVVLGSMETTLIDITNAYSIIVNGGKRTLPTLIDRIQDRNGNTIYKHDNRVCLGCKLGFSNVERDENDFVLPKIRDNRSRVVDARSAYQITSMLEGVVKHTRSSRKVKELNRTLGGKTGTTNKSYDAWFIGFSADLVVGTYIGFDEPKTLGANETGATVAQPIFVDFMRKALKGVPDVPFRVPAGIKIVKVDHKTGRPSYAANGTIYESFKVGTEPKYKPGIFKKKKKKVKKKFNNKRKKSIKKQEPDIDITAEGVY